MVKQRSHVVDVGGPEGATVATPCLPCHRLEASSATGHLRLQIGDVLGEGQLRVELNVEKGRVLGGGDLLSVDRESGPNSTSGYPLPSPPPKKKNIES